MQMEQEGPRSGALQFEAAAITDAGKVRAVNEDNFYFNGAFCPQDHSSAAYYEKRISGDALPVFAVFDGMGGYSAGERSSFLAAETADRLFGGAGGRDEALLRRLCTEANTAVCAEMQRSGKRTGTTASMLLFDQAGGYSVCNLGDSPVLLIRGGSITEISVEHTERQKFEEVTGKKAAPGKKFKLTQHIGIFPEEMEIEPYLHREQVRPGDVFLICSDGLTDMVPYEEILATVTRSGTAEEAVAALCTMAKEAGGKDNITIICIRAAQSAVEAPADPFPVKRVWFAFAALLILLAALCVMRFWRKPAAEEGTELPAETETVQLPEESAAPTEPVTEGPEQNPEESAAPTEPVSEQPGQPQQRGTGAE